MKSGDGVMVIDPDKVRATHPRYADLMREDDGSAAAKTAE